MLVSTPAPGPYAALPIARALDRAARERGPRGALRTALDDPPADYAARARRGARAVQRATDASSRARRASELLPRAVADLLPASRAPATAACWRPAAAPSHARRAVATPQRMFASVSVRWASESITIRTPAARGGARVDVGEVAAVGVGVDLEHRPGPRGGREHRVEVDRVGRAALDQPAGRVADRVDQRVLDRRRSCARSSPARSMPERRCARSRSPSRARRAARPRSRASRRAGC